MYLVPIRDLFGPTILSDLIYLLPNLKLLNLGCDYENCINRNRYAGKVLYRYDHVQEGGPAGQAGGREEEGGEVQWGRSGDKRAAGHPQVNRLSRIY